MIVLDCVQGSDEWHSARLGIPTVSRFGEIMTPKTLKPSASAGKYMRRLLVEHITGEPQDSVTTPLMQRGSEMEAEAAAWYEAAHDVDTEAVGFILADDRAVGGSPDRLVGDDGGLEIKCPSATTHMEWLLGEAGDPHRSQVQGYLWLTGREWWDLLIYHPALPTVEQRIYHDPKWQEAWAGILPEFLDRLAQAKERLKEQLCQD